MPSRARPTSCLTAATDARGSGGSRGTAVTSAKACADSYVGVKLACWCLADTLRTQGFIVYGHRDSPIIPMLIFEPGKMPVFSRLMLERYKIVVVVVAYPATPLVSSRVRFCLSAAHTKEDIDVILRATDEIGGALGLRLAPRASSRPHGVAAHSTHDDDLGWFGLARRGGRMSIDEVIAHAEDIADGRI